MTKDFGVFEYRHACLFKKDGLVLLNKRAFVYKRFVHCRFIAVWKDPSACI